MREEPFRAENQYISLYTEEKLRQSKVQSAHYWLRIKKSTGSLSSNMEK